LLMMGLPASSKTGASTVMPAAFRRTLVILVVTCAEQGPSLISTQRRPFHRAGTGVTGAELKQLRRILVKRSAGP
jgi:hypothetical protein